MADVILFTGLMVAILVGYLIYKLRHNSWREYFSSRTGRGILKGIILAPIVILLIGLAMMIFAPEAKAGTWLNDASVFAGIDYTNKQSPQCNANQVDNKGTSNLGARLNLWQSESRAVRVNSKYTHHSCVLGSDDRQYDAIGIEVEWQVWKR